MKLRGKWGRTGVVKRWKKNGERGRQEGKKEGKSDRGNLVWLLARLACNPCWSGVSSNLHRTTFRFLNQETFSTLQVGGMSQKTYTKEITHTHTPHTPG